MKFSFYYISLITLFTLSVAQAGTLNTPDTLSKKLSTEIGNTQTTTATNSADEGEPSRDDSSHVFHVYNDIDLVSTMKIQYGKPKIIIKSVYPQLVSDTESENASTFNDAALQIVQDEIGKFKEHVHALKNPQGAKGNNNLYIDYDTSYIQSNHNHLISIRFTIQAFIAGMAHPYHYHRVLNYNLDTNQTLELSDLFAPESNYLELLSNYAKHALERRLSNKQFIDEGTAPTPENYAIWNIKPTGIVITFDEAKVAPYVDGAQTILIPFSALKEVIPSESPIFGCVNHQRRCLSNNLLTGGFIDEAIDTKHGSFNPLLS